MPKGLVTPGWMEIYADTVTIGLLKGRSFSVVIQNQEVADSFKIYAQLLWSLGKNEDWPASYFSYYASTTTIFIYYYAILCITMETVSLRFEEGFLNEIENVMKEHRYSTKTEFIREAVRDKIKDLEKEKALLRLEKAYGAGAKKGKRITDKHIHQAGEEAIQEIARKLGIRV